MIYKVEISKQAQVDLEKIYEYISFTLLSPKNAERELNRLEKSILKLDHMPKRFEVYESEPWFSRGMRSMPVDNFVVLYIPDDEKSTVTVIRVLHGGRDIDREMREYAEI